MKLFFCFMWIENVLCTIYSIVRMSQDRLQIIVKALETKPNAYKNVPRVRQRQIVFSTISTTVELKCILLIQINKFLRHAVRGLIIRFVVQLLKLGHQLRVAGSSSNKKQEEEGKVLRLVAQAAIKAKDVRVATETCQQLMTLGYGAAWPECRTVADMDVRDVTLK